MQKKPLSELDDQMKQIGKDIFADSSTWDEVQAEVERLAILRAEGVSKRKKNKILKEKEGEQFITDNKGNIIVNEENVYRTMVADILLDSKIRYNTFRGSIEVCFEKTESGAPNGVPKWERIQNADIVGIQTHFQRTYPHFVKISKQMIESGVVRTAEKNKISPPREWMRSLKWDEVPRLDSWISNTYNTPNDAYHQTVGANWMKGLVKRIIHPGCKFDYVIVLEGEQGTKKSMSFSILGGGEYHTEITVTPDSKDFFMSFSGKMIVEFSEGETLSRTDTKKLKAVITMQNDNFRPPYERSTADFPRQCVFAMTTNQSEYLKDETGNRRWLPIAVQGMVNIDWLRENRVQLFAEAYHRVITLGETTWEFPEEETKAHQMAREIADPRAEKIYDWYFTKLGIKEREEGISTNMAYAGGVHGGSTFGREMTKADEMVIAGILRNYICLEKRRTMLNNLRVVRFFPTEKTMKLAPDGTVMFSSDELFKNYGKIEADEIDL